jgi:hypothetical protein
METDNWNDLSKKLRDFSPTPPASIKSAIDQHIDQRKKRVFGHFKFGLFLSVFALALTIGVVYLFTDNQEQMAVNQFSELTNQEEGSPLAAQHQGKGFNNKANIESKNSDLIAQEKKTTATTLYEQTLSSNVKSKSKERSKIVDSDKSKFVSNTSSKNKISKFKNASLAIKHSPKSTKSTSSKSAKQHVPTFRKSQKKTKQIAINGESDLVQSAMNDQKSSNSLISDISDSDLGLNQFKPSSLKKANGISSDNKSETTGISENTNDFEQSTSNGDSNTLSEELKIDSVSAEETETPSNSKGILTEKKTMPSKHEIGLYAGPLFKGKERNASNTTIKSFTGLQMNVYYGRNIKPRLKVNAGFSYDRKREMLTQTTQAYDTSYYQTVIQVVQNPADSSFDTLTFTQLQNTTIASQTKVNESVISRYGLTTSLTFLAVQRRTWGYSIRFGNVIYFSTENKVRNETASFNLEMKKWSGALFLDNFVSKSFGRTNFLVGFSTNYSYSQSYNWLSFKTKSLILSPFIGVSYHF